MVSLWWFDLFSRRCLGPQTLVNHCKDIERCVFKEIIFFRVFFIAIQFTYLGKQKIAQKKIVGVYILGEDFIVSITEQQPLFIFCNSGFLKLARIVCLSGKFCVDSFSRLFTLIFIFACLIEVSFRKQMFFVLAFGFHRWSAGLVR